MPSDLPDFYIPGTSYPVRDWGSKTKVYRMEFIVPVESIEPGKGVSTGWMEQPAGKILYFCDTWQSSEFKAHMRESTKSLGTIMRKFFRAYTFYRESWTIPLPIPPGEEWEIGIRNQDIVPGHFSIGISGWEEPYSPWPTPKKGDPIERWNLKHYNKAVHHLLPNGEKIVIFKRDDEDIISSVHIENLGTDKQKVVAASFLNEEERGEVEKNMGKKPQNVGKILAKYGKKYKAWRKTW